MRWLFPAADCFRWMGSALPVRRGKDFPVLGIRLTCLFNCRHVPITAVSQLKESFCVRDRYEFSICDIPCMMIRVVSCCSKLPSVRPISTLTVSLLGLNCWDRCENHTFAADTVLSTGSQHPWLCVWDHECICVWLHAAFCVSSVVYFLFQPTAGSDACCVNDSGNSEGRQQVDGEWSITMCCLLEERQAAHFSYQ